MAKKKIFLILFFLFQVSSSNSENVNSCLSDSSFQEINKIQNLNSISINIPNSRKWMKNMFLIIQNNGFTKPYSEERAKIMDEEVTKLVEEQYERAKQIIIKNKDKAENLATSLLENEVIFKADLEDIFGKRKWKSYEEEKLNEMDKNS